MSSLTDRIFQAAMEGLLNRDSVLCSQVVADDYEIDILEKQVDRDGVNLLLRFHPVASDMREVISAMKVGDYSISPVIREGYPTLSKLFRWSYAWKSMPRLTKGKVGRAQQLKSLL